jgi:hypothetical protein
MRSVQINVEVMMTDRYFTSPSTRNAPINPYALDLVEHSVRWMDQYWDADAGLLGMPTYEGLSALTRVHHIRETGWYALGLLQRGTKDDKQRACEALQAILRYQFDEPGRPYDGTWYRFPEEPHPGDMPIWKGYDPNWREFIGSTLAIILLDYKQELPATLVAAIDSALHKAIRGMLARNLPASYTNIALMHAFLLLFAGERFGEADWMRRGEQFAQEIYDLFAPNQTFSEYNSPTYYGIDVYALGLWRTYATSPLLQTLGTHMEAALWQDIALLYHAGMKNMSGPYDRSYGMDMQRYASTIGMWIWMAVGRDAAPFPDIAHPFDHAHDFCLAPCCVAVDVNIPPEALRHLKAFQGERQVERVINSEPKRVASAWIGNKLLVGGEYTSYSQPASDQIHPATIHWTSSNNQIGWIKLAYTIPVNATAAKDRLTIACIADDDTPDFVFQIYAPARKTLQHNLWQLPGLTVHVVTNIHYLETKENEGYTEVCYSAKELAPGTLIEFVLTIQDE